MTLTMSIPQDRIFRNLILLTCIAAAIALIVPNFLGFPIHKGIPGQSSIKVDGSLLNDVGDEVTPHGPRLNNAAEKKTDPVAGVSDRLTLISKNQRFAVSLVAADDGAHLEMLDLKDRNPRLLRLALDKGSADLVLHGGECFASLHSSSSESNIMLNDVQRTRLSTLVLKRDQRLGNFADGSSALMLLKFDEIGAAPPVANVALFADDGGVGKLQLTNFPMVKMYSCPAEPPSELDLPSQTERQASGSGGTTTPLLTMQPLGPLSD